MLIEVKGTGQGNKGAEMMLLTILDEFKNTNFKFVISPKIDDCEYSFYSKLGMYPKIPVRFKGFNSLILHKVLPNSIAKAFGLVKDNEIDVILDASGFSYTSQWGDKPTKIMAEDCKRWKSNGARIILLPQSFGPFNTESIKNSMKDIIKYSDLIYARDKYSFNLLNEIYPSKKIKLSPDFTVLFNGKESLHLNKTRNKVCLVPNIRMTDKHKDGDQYINFFVRIITQLTQNNIEAFFLVHAGREDKILMEQINSKLEKDILIIEEENPYYIKGIIENSLGLIGSRYHSIASALYSGIPVIGTGWSHKYQYLFSEFNYIEGLIDINANKDELNNKLMIFIDDKKKNEISNKLRIAKEIYEEKTINMFKEVKECILSK